MLPEANYFLISREFIILCIMMTIHRLFLGSDHRVKATIVKRVLMVGRYSNSLKINDII
jgi:hypothetical protein